MSNIIGKINTAVGKLKQNAGHKSLRDEGSDQEALGKDQVDEAAKGTPTGKTK